MLPAYTVMASAAAGVVANAGVGQGDGRCHRVYRRGQGAHHRLAGSGFACGQVVVHGIERAVQINMQRDEAAVVTGSTVGQPMKLSKCWALVTST